MKRVGSVGSMAEAGGSAIDLTKRFLAKTVLLIACVYLLSAKAETMPRLVLELVYGKPYMWSNPRLYLHGSLRLDLCQNIPNSILCMADSTIRAVTCSFCLVRFPWLPDGWTSFRLDKPNRP